MLLKGLLKDCGLRDPGVSLHSDEIKFVVAGHVPEDFVW